MRLNPYTDVKEYKSGDFLEFAKEYGLTINTNQHDKVLCAIALLRTWWNSTRQAMFVQSAGEFNRRYTPVIAGGAISRIFRKDDGGDIDVYGRHTRSIATAFIRQYGTQSVINKSDHSMLKLRVEAMEYNFIYDTEGYPDIILDTFDFNICRLAYSVVDDKIYYVDEAITDLRRKTLSFAKTNWANVQNKKYKNLRHSRIQKYAAMGYNLDFDEIMATIPLGDAEEIKEDDSTTLTETEQYDLFHDLMGEATRLYYERYGRPVDTSGDTTTLTNTVNNPVYVVTQQSRWQRVEITDGQPITGYRLRNNVSNVVR